MILDQDLRKNMWRCKIRIVICHYGMEQHANLIHLRNLVPLQWHSSFVRYQGKVTQNELLTLRT